MEYITDIEKLKGKTISKAVLVDCDEQLVITFQDDTCVCIDVIHHGDSYNIELMNTLDIVFEKEAGIITKEEFNIKRETQIELNRSTNEHRERNQLAMLQAKYANKQD